MIHVNIDSHTGNLIQANHNILEGSCNNNIDLLTAGLDKMCDTLTIMNAKFAEMWNYVKIES